MITLDQIWDNHRTELQRFIQNKIGDPATSEDILQDVLLRAYQRLDTLADPNRLQAWLYQITRNAIIDHYRRERQTVELSETIPMPESEELTPLETLAGCVPSMIDDLNGPYREALQLAGLQGLQQQTVAEQLGISVSGAKSRVQRGRSQLKDLLLKCCWFEFDRRGSLTDYGAHQCGCTN